MSEELYQARLVDRLYGALFGEGSWDEFLSDLNLGLPAGGSAFLYHDVAKGAGAFGIQNGVPDEWSRAYADHYSRINPWMSAASKRKVGLGVVAEQMLPRSLLVKTEFYNDFYRKIDRESAVGITIAREHGRSLLLSTFTSSADAERNKTAADRLTRLAPHLRRVFDHIQARDRDAVIAGLGAEVLGALNIGIVTVGTGGYAHRMSDLAQAMIEESGCVRFGVLGNIKFSDRAAQDLLYAMLDKPWTCPRSITFRVNGMRVTLILLQRDQLSTFFIGPTVVVTIEHLRPAQLDFEALRQEFQLTSAELKAIGALHGGQTISEAATRAGVSRETIRAHIKSAFQKTRTNRQVDLLRLVSDWTANNMRR